MSTRFDTIHERAGQTDGRTDTARRHMPRLCMQQINQPTNQLINQPITNQPITNPKVDVGRDHPWVWLGWVGSQNSASSVGRVGSGPLSNISNKYAIYMQEIRLSFLMIRSCNIAIFISVYLFIPFWLFGLCFCRMVTCGAHHNEE